MLKEQKIKIFTDSFFKRVTSLSTSRKYLVAYSGGMDSHILLQLISELSQRSDSEMSIRALHVHHGLQKEADEWVNHCKAVCKGLGVSLQVCHLNLNISSGDSLEAVAREGRYKAIEKSLQADEILLTGHHQRDQAETFLLQLFRGSGVQGLASMPEITTFSHGQHIRPLLNERYESLYDYAEKKQLKYITDPSNKDNSFDRNFLRNEILPQLRRNWKGIDKTIARSASIQSETKSVLDEVANEILNDFPSRKTLSIRHLLDLSVVKQKLILRYWITEKGFLAPSEIKMMHLIEDVIQAREDAQPLLNWQGVEVRRFRNNLYCEAPLTEHDATQVIEWTGNEPLNLDKLGIEILPSVLDNLTLENFPLTVRFRQGGEKLFMPKQGHSKSLKSLLNEAGIEPWLRDRLPLIYSGNKLIYIIGLEEK